MSLKLAVRPTARLAFAAATLIVAAEGSARAQHTAPVGFPRAMSPPPVVQFTPVVAHTWALLYREFRTEFLGCLYGTVGVSYVPFDPDTIVVSHMLMADVKPSRSTDRSVAEGSPCPVDRNLLGMVHSHPGGRSCVHDGRGNCAPLEEARRGDICFASRADSATFAASGYLIDVIVCGYGRFMTTTRDQAVIHCEYDPDEDWPVCTNGPAAPATVRERRAGLP